MSLLPILIWPDPRLSTRCEPVGAEGVTEDLIRDLFETMYDAPGRGLAAPQVGVMQRVFVMDAGWKDGTMTPRACIDPEIIWRSDESGEAKEGCLSIPGVSVPVTRPTTIRLAYTSAAGVRIEEGSTGAEALIAQHEIDHLDGLVTLDRVDEAVRADILSIYTAQ